MSCFYFLVFFDVLTNIISSAAIFIYPIAITEEIDKIHLPGWIVEQGTNKFYLVGIFLAALVCGPFISWLYSLEARKETKKHTKLHIMFLRTIEWMYFSFAVTGALLAIQWTQTGTLISVTSAIEERLTGKIVSSLENYLEREERISTNDSVELESFETN